MTWTLDDFESPKLRILNAHILKAERGHRRLAKKSAIVIQDPLLLLVVIGMMELDGYNEKQVGRPQRLVLTWLLIKELIKILSGCLVFT